MTAARVLAAAVVLSASSAWADTTFTITITNNSSQTWTDGVLAILPEASSPNALLSVGGVPISGDQFDTQAYVHSTCDPRGEDDGNAATLIARWDPLTSGVNAHIVSSLGPGADATVTFTANPGDVLSFVARVSGATDDAVMMHAVGDTSDTTIDLFDGDGLPVPAVLFNIGGYDVESASSGSGTGPACSGASCPWSSATCFVAYGNGTTGGTAGGAQATPFNFDAPFWTVVQDSYTPDGIAVGQAHPAAGEEIVVMMEGSTWYGDPITAGTGKVVVLRDNGMVRGEFLPATGRDIMGIPLITTVAGAAGYVVGEFLSSADGGAVYALRGQDGTPADARWIMSPMDWPGAWNMGASAANLFGGSAQELVIPSWGGIVNVVNPVNGSIYGTYDTFTAHDETLYGHAAIGDVASATGPEIVLVGGRHGRVIVLDPTNSSLTLVYASNVQASGYALGSGAAIGNIDGDAALEIVVAYKERSGHGYVQAFDIQNDGSGTCEYQWDAPTAGGGYFWTSPVIGDIDGDGDNEIVVQNNDSVVSVLTTSGVTPTPGTCQNGAFLVQAYQIGVGGGSWWTPALANLYGDDGVEIVAASYDTLEILYYANGRLNVAHRAVDASATFYPSAAIQRRPSGAGAAARIYVSGWINGLIYRFNTPSSAPLPTSWSTFMGNNARTGLAP